MVEHKPHISEFKKKEVAHLQQLLETYPIIGVVNLSGLPTRMLQKIKKSLHQDVEFKITKKRLIKIALDNCKKENIQQLKEKLDDNVCLLFTKLEPFPLAKNIERSKTSAPIKAGQIAPIDLEVPEGPTPFTPGPMIGELGVLGLKTEVKAGKIHVRSGKVIAKKGEPVSQKASEILAKIGVEPMKLGLNLTYVYENGQIIEGKVLIIDEEEYFNNIARAHADALALAMEVGYITKDNAPLLIGKAHREAKAVIKDTDVMTSENVGEKLAEAEKTAEALKEKVPEVPAEEKKEESPVEPKEEPKAEEQSPEPVQEETVKEVKEPESPQEPVEKVKQEEPIEEKQEEPVEQPKEEEVPQKPVQEEPKEESLEQKEQPKEQIDEKKEASIPEVGDADPQAPPNEETMQNAESLLKEMGKKAFSVEGSQKKRLGETQDFNVNKFINKLKDGKS